MAFAAVRPPVGFQARNVMSPGDEFWLPGVAGATVEVNNAISKNAIGTTSNAGLFIRSTDSLVPTPFVSKRGLTIAAATVGFPTGGPASEDYLADASSSSLPKDTLIPCTYIGPPMQILDVPMVGYADDVLAAYTAATPSVTLTTGLGADDDANGALIYIYSGAGAGQWNWCVDYVESTKVVTLARRFTVAPDTTSNVIITEGETASSTTKSGVGIYGRCDSHDHDAVHVADGSDDGDWLVMLDARLVPEYMRRGCLPVMKIVNAAA